MELGVHNFGKWQKKEREFSTGHCFDSMIMTHMELQLLYVHQSVSKQEVEEQQQSYALSQ